MRIFIITISIVLCILCLSQESADQRLLRIDKLMSTFHKQKALLFDYIKNGRCKHIYLDMGSNRGVQIRKLYEPDLYFNATIIPFFNEHFGVDHKQG